MIRSIASASFQRSTMLFSIIIACGLLAAPPWAAAVTTDLGTGGLPHCSSLCKAYGNGYSNTGCTVTKTTVTPVNITTNAATICDLGQVMVETVDKNNNRAVKCYQANCSSADSYPHGFLCSDAGAIKCAKVAPN